MSRTPHVPPRRRRRAVRTVVVAAVAGVLAVVLGGAAADDQAGTSAPAFLRTAHLLGDLGPVDVRLTPFSAEGDRGPAGPGAAVRTAAYGAVDSYAAVAPGDYAVTVRLSAGAEDTDPVVSGSVTLRPGLAYTVVAAGPEGTRELQLLEDDLTPPPPGQAEVRLYSSVPRAQVALDGGPVAGDGLAAGYVPVAAGDRLLEVSDGVSSTSLTVGLVSRSSYTVFVRPGPGGAIGVQAVLDQAAAEQVPAGGIDTGGGWLAAQGTTPAGRPALLAPAGPALTGLVLTGLVLTGLVLILLARGRGRPVR